MVIKSIRSFELGSVALALFCLMTTAYAQDDPCVPAYRLSSCDSNDSACKAREDREYEASVARCRAGRNRKSNPPPSSNNPPPPPQPNQPTYDPDREVREREAKEREREARERANREEEERARERTRAYNEQKNRGRGTASSAEEGTLSNDADARTRAFNQQKAQQNNQNPDDGIPDMYYSDGTKIPRPDRFRREYDWIIQPNKEKGLTENKGSWRVANVMVNCGGIGGIAGENDSYLLATVVNAKGNPSCMGGYLEVQNTSSQYPVYYGMSTVLNEELKPGESRMIMLSIYRTKRDKRMTRVPLKILWWVPKSK